MAQPSSRIITSDQLAAADSKNYFVEVATLPVDFASAEHSFIFSTVPFLPEGLSFTDIPLYVLGATQNFSTNEGLPGQFIPEIGSARKVNTAGSAMGSGVISRLMFHGNSLVAALYRPTLQFIKNTETLSTLTDKIMASSNDIGWIKGLIVDGVDLFDVDLNTYVDRVVASGGLNSILYKIPFGLIQVKRDAKNEGLEIMYYEQCAIRGDHDGLSAGQFQLTDSISFDFERRRSLLAAGPFSISTTSTVGI